MVLNGFIFVVCLVSVRDFRERLKSISRMMYLIV